MKYLYQTVVTLLLLSTVQKLDSQERSLDLGISHGDLTAIPAKPGVSPDDSLDRGLGWLIGEDTNVRDDVPNAAAHRSHVPSICLGDSLGAAGSGENAKQRIIVDLKVPDPLFDIVGLNVDQRSNGYLIRIHCTKQLPDFESWLKPIGNDTWLYITLADARADVVVLEDFVLTAFVKKVLIFQSATSVQITFMLKGQVSKAELIRADGSQDILALVFTPADAQSAIRSAR
jgi:hypothetical protein